MSKLYVFCIGGTGSRVVRSLTMMMAAGVEMGTNEVIPIVIDPDSSNADLTRTIAIMNRYQAIRSNLHFSNNISTKFFRKELTRVLPNYTLHIEDTDDKTFQQFIDLPSMDKASQAMMRMLFSQKNLDSSMEVGFKGNPNIGSVVLNQIVASDGFQEFANGFDNGDKIFIISSIFGGTGASGFPLLLKTLRTGENFPNHDLINNAEIGAISVLPYFKVETSDESEIDSSTFISKTKSALAYYERNISKNNSIDALYFLADDTTNTYHNNEGGSAQRNDAHLIEFLAASAIVDFTLKSHTNTVNKELGLKDLTDVVTFNSFHDAQRRQFLVPLTALTMMANCLYNKFEDYSGKGFNANGSHFKNIYNSPFMSELRAFLQQYLEWLDEMKRNKRSLDLFNLNCQDSPFDVITDVKAGKVFSTRSNHDLIKDRLNGAVKKCHSKEECDKFLEMYSLGLRQVIKDKFKAE